MNKLKLMSKLTECTKRRIALESQFYEQGIFIPEAWEDLAAEQAEFALVSGAEATRKRAQQIAARPAL